jgi:predicted RNase H-like HicB family nuclease
MHSTEKLKFAFCQGSRDEFDELPGCIAHGDTQESALAHAHEAMQLWIDTAKEYGHPVPQPKGERLMLA